MMPDVLHAKHGREVQFKNCKKGKLLPWRKTVTQVLYMIAQNVVGWIVKEHFQ